MTKSKEETSAKKAPAPKKAETAKKAPAPKKVTPAPKKVTPAPKKAEFKVGSLVLDHKDREYTILEMPTQLSDYSKIVLKDSQGNSLVRLKLKLRLK